MAIDTPEPRWHAWLQFGLQFSIVRRRAGRTRQGRWSRLNRSEPPRPELLMRHTVQRGRTATPPDNRQLARPQAHRVSWDDGQAQVMHCGTDLLQRDTCIWQPLMILRISDALGPA